MRLALRVLVTVLAGQVVGALSARAQELEPRAYSPSPVGANFAGLVYGTSWGSLVFDPTVPITDAEATLHGVTLAYGRTFALASQQALVTLAVPYLWGDFVGKVAGLDSSVTREGAGDVRAKFSVNLVGGRARTPREFAQAPAPDVVGGVSLTVTAPTGENFPDRAINLGANRWGFKPEAGVSWHVRPRWYADLYAGTWIFTPNTEAYPGTSRRQQDPLASVQAHLSYTFARRSWAALDGTWYWGGATSLDGGPKTARQDNKRAGAVLAFGVTARQSVKLSYSYGASTRVGDDFGTLVIGYQLLWF